VAPICDEDFENSCWTIIFTYNSVDHDDTIPDGGYSSRVVVHERLLERIAKN
jgi:cinnamyl-alcohol dehydrogenase